MKHNVWVAIYLLFFAALAQAKLVIHIQSPWRDDPSKEGYFLHMLGGAGGGYNPYFDENSSTRMVDEGDGWFSYTWEKDASDFQDWESFNIKIFPNTADGNFNNNNGAEWKVAGDMKIGQIFGTDTEVWLYTSTADMTYEKSFVAPGSKMVWFKSPWGNHALPMMIFGQDSILMRFAQDDETKCGWFYGAVSPAAIKANPTMTAHFIRYRTPYMSAPAEGVVDLAEALDYQDSIFIDGTLDEMGISMVMGNIGQCFDSTYVLHVYHPWRNNSTFKDSAVYITIGNNILNNPVAMTADGDYPYWYHYDFDAKTVASTSWSSSMASFNIYRRQNEWPQVTYFSQAQLPKASILFPTGVYETWIYTRSAGAYELLFSPLEPKVIRLKSPWDNMSPTMITVDDTIRMGPLVDTCGWYQGISYKHVDDWSVLFRQSFGTEFYSFEGLMGEGGDIGAAISLDSMVALKDTIWVYPYPLSSSPPKFDTLYPGILGICPKMKISAMLLDWAAESYDDSIDIDFGGIYGGNAYTTVIHDGNEYKTCGGHILGMVQDTLSVYGLPLRVDSLDFPWDKCSAGRELDKWFVPVVVATDARGKEYTNATCRDIDLSLDAEGFWLADVTESPNGCNDSINPGFYPLDDFEFLDSAKTVRNPKFDWDVRGCRHNYGFSMKITARFKYIKGQYFEFRGDDDVWVYINDRLVVDIGGCHSPVEGAVDLDTLGLVEGEEYPFNIFFSERNATGSNFKMRTSINLQTQKTYFPVGRKNPNGTIEYELLQLLVDESLSCDVSSTAKVDTTYAQSVFKLVGGKLPQGGEILGPGLNYGGIYISENMAGFMVDTSAFVNSRMLDPGNYVLYCYLASDQSQYQAISFTIPEYPLPDIAFVDVFNPADSFVALNPLGLSLRGIPFDGSSNDTLLAHVSYPDAVPLMVTVLMNSSTRCGDMLATAKVNCVVELELKSTYPLSFLDKNGLPIKKLVTDSLGNASFYVVGDSAMVNGFFTIYGNGVNNDLLWGDIHFREPPVPFASRGSMYDRNGDGIPDSLYVPFSKPFEDVVPDTLSWLFGGTNYGVVFGQENIWPLVNKDSILVLVNDNGLREGVFTGSASDPYLGSFLYHYTYMDKDTRDSVKLDMNTQITDRVGPIAIGATIETVSEDISVVHITLSEGTSAQIVNGATLFEFYRDTANIMSTLRISSTKTNAQGNLYSVFFQREEGMTLPSVGDYVRLAPGILEDRSGNVPHIMNPKVRIVGEQRTDVEAPGVITISQETPWPYVEPIVPISVPANKTVQDVIDSLGMPGLLLSFDIGELATTMVMNLPEGANKDSALATIKISWEAYYYSHLGHFVNEAHGDVLCSDARVFFNPSDPSKSNCYDNPGNIFFEWNARSENGRVVGTGAYITKMKLKVHSGSNVMGENEDTYTIGIRRGM